MIATSLEKKKKDSDIRLKSSTHRVPSREKQINVTEDTKWPSDEDERWLSLLFSLPPGPSF